MRYPDDKVGLSHTCAVLLLSKEEARGGSGKCSMHGSCVGIIIWNPAAVFIRPRRKNPQQIFAGVFCAYFTVLNTVSALTWNSEANLPELQRAQKPNSTLLTLISLPFSTVVYCQVLAQGNSRKR